MIIDFYSQKPVLQTPEFASRKTNLPSASPYFLVVIKNPELTVGGLRPHVKKANKIDMNQARTNIKTGMPMIPFDKMFKLGISK